MQKNIQAGANNFHEKNTVIGSWSTGSALMPEESCSWSIWKVSNFYSDNMQLFFLQNIMKTLNHFGVNKQLEEKLLC